MVENTEILNDPEILRPVKGVIQTSSMGTGVKKCPTSDIQTLPNFNND